MSDDDVLREIEFIVLNFIVVLVRDRVQSEMLSVGLDFDIECFIDGRNVLLKIKLKYLNYDCFIIVFGIVIIVFVVCWVFVVYFYFKQLFSVIDVVKIVYLVIDMFMNLFWLFFLVYFVFNFFIYGFVKRDIKNELIKCLMC